MRSLVVAWFSAAIAVAIGAMLVISGEQVLSHPAVSIAIVVALLPAASVHLVLWIWPVQEYRYWILLLLPLFYWPLVGLLAVIAIVPIGFLAILTARHLRAHSTPRA